MFRYLFKGMLLGVVLKVVNDYRRVSTQLLKLEAAKVYIHGVQVARQSAFGLLRMGLMIGLVCVGALLFHVGLFIVLPGSLVIKGLLAMLLGLGYVAWGWVALRAAMDEQTWMRQSGATAMLAAVTAPPATGNSSVNHG